jgi:predicted nucleic acid-binding protein
MTRRMSHADVTRNPRAVINTPELACFWKEQIRTFGRSVFFVETGCVLASLTPSTQAMVAGLLKELVSNRLSDRLVTSTYVITEAIRRLVKSKPREFVGPGGEQKTDLALYLLFEWLTDNNVAIICPPDAVFDEAKRLFREHRALGCDLSDIISYVIVRGLEQDRILSQDGHFRSLGLITLWPSPVA